MVLSRTSRRVFARDLRNWPSRESAAIMSILRLSGMSQGSGSSFSASRSDFADVSMMCRWRRWCVCKRGCMGKKKDFEGKVSRCLAWLLTLWIDLDLDVSFQLGKDVSSLFSFALAFAIPFPISVSLFLSLFFFFLDFIKWRMLRRSISLLFLVIIRWQGGDSQREKDLRAVSATSALSFPEIAEASSRYKLRDRPCL